jgi:hypothetical protein
MLLLEHAWTRSAFPAIPQDVLSALLCVVVVHAGDAASG